MAKYRTFWIISVFNILQQKKGQVFRYESDDDQQAIITNKKNDFTNKANSNIVLFIII